MQLCDHVGSIHFLVKFQFSHITAWFLSSLVYLLRKSLKLFGLPIFWLCAYLIKVITVVHYLGFLNNRRGNQEKYNRETDNIGYTRHKTKTDKTPPPQKKKTTTQYVLDIVIYLFVWWCLTPISTIFHWQTLSHNVVHLALIELRTHNISGDRHRLHS